MAQLHHPRCGCGGFFIHSSSRLHSLGYNSVVMLYNSVVMVCRQLKEAKQRFVALKRAQQQADKKRADDHKRQGTNGNDPAIIEVCIRMWHRSISIINVRLPYHYAVSSYCTVITNCS